MTAKVDDQTEVSRAVARIHAGVLALVCAILGGGGLFIMTIWLLIKGGARVGEHLNLLGQYFYGYSVTWFGSLVGLAWGIAVGGVLGWTIGEVYNLVVWIRQRGGQTRS